MKNIGIFANEDKDKGLEFTKELIEKAKILGMSAEIADKRKNYDIIISLGGDGTFLSAATKFVKKDIAIVGINLGHLGYLSSVAREEADEVLVSILNDNYEIEERTLLEVFTGNKTLYGLNDVVLSRGNYKKMLELEVFLDGKFLDKYSADGVLVSTPTGSTAYSLSVGGPIIEPVIDALLINPICPHSLNKRSLIISSDRIITVKAKSEQSFVLTTDGHKSITGLKFAEIRKASHTVKVVKLNDNFFFERLREKFKLI